MKLQVNYLKLNMKIKRNQGQKKGKSSCHSFSPVVGRRYPLHLLPGESLSAPSQAALQKDNQTSHNLVLELDLAVLDFLCLSYYNETVMFFHADTPNANTRYDMRAKINTFKTHIISLPAISRTAFQAVCKSVLLI